MKRINLFMMLLFLSIGLSAQDILNDISGTWVYQKNDTIFKVKLQKGTIKAYIEDIPSIFGGYQLIVKGKVVENHIKKLPSEYQGSNPPSENIFIDGIKTGSQTITFTFYDQRINHASGRGLILCKMILISPNKLHWKLEEEKGLWWAVEGSDEPYILKGFSIPSDVIMTKEQ